MGDTMDKMSGKSKQAAGKMSGDKSLQAKGKFEEAKGDIKGKLKDYGNSDNNNY